MLLSFGHTFPIFLNFKGGKGVATALGILLFMNWQVGLICLVFALAVIVATRMVSAGSCTAAILYPVLTLFGVGSTHLVSEGSYVIFSILLAAIIIFNHRANIKRILEGKENKLNFNR